MMINQLENNKHISEANKWLEVLKEKAYLELGESEKAAVKKIYKRLSDEASSYQSPNAFLCSVLEQLTSVLDGQEGFFWAYAE